MALRRGVEPDYDFLVNGEQNMDMIDNYWPNTILGYVENEYGDAWGDGTDGDGRGTDEPAGKTFFSKDNYFCAENTVYEYMSAIEILSCFAS